MSNAFGLFVPGAPAVWRELPPGYGVVLVGCVEENDVVWCSRTQQFVAADALGAWEQGQKVGTGVVGMRVSLLPLVCRKV